jgi:hypothetical protein
MTVGRSSVNGRMISSWVIDGSLWRINGYQRRSVVLTMVVMVDQNRLLIKDGIRSCHRHRNFDTDRYFYTNWDVDVDWNFDPDRNLNGNGNVLDNRYFNRNGLRHSVRDSVRLWDGDGCSNWKRNTVAFAESFFKPFAETVMMSSSRDFIVGS